jgi:hypothetical protein
MRASLRRLFRIAHPPAGALSHPAPRLGFNRRFTLMMQHTWLVGIAAVLLCVGVGGIWYYYATLPAQLRFAVGPPNSEDVRVVQAMAAQLGRDHASVRLQVSVLDSARTAGAAIDNGQADAAVVRRDAGLPRNAQVVAILRKNVVVFVVPGAADSAKDDKAEGAKETKATKPGKKVAKAEADDEEEDSAKATKPAKASKGSKGGKPAKAAKADKDKAKPTAKDDGKNAVDKISALVGRRLGIVGRSPSNVELLKIIVRQYGIASDKVVLLTGDDVGKPNAPDKISVVQFDINNVGPQIRDSNVDAIMAVGPVSSQITADAIAAATRGKEPPTFLAIGAAEAIAERNPIYESTEIKAGAFGGSPPRPEESVDTIGVNHYIVVRRGLGEGVVADFTKHLFAIRQSLTAELPSAAKIEKPDTDKDAPVPVHPGASAYLDGELKSFFDRYNDLFYWGLMALSLFGSAFAGLLSYNKADDRVRRLAALERLLDIARAARKANTVQAISELEASLDAIQAEMIQEVEANTLDETAMMAFQVSFEQARTAISDRRAIVAGLARPPLAAVAPT